jgi:hypothetical protein
MYQLFFNSRGQFESANTDGISIPYYPLNPDYSDLSNELTIAFLAAIETGEVDVSDRPATPEPKEPNWDEFYQAQKLLLANIIDQSSNRTFATMLMIEFGKRPDINTANLIDYWNASVAALLNTESITALNTSAQQCNLPVHITQSGTMEPV